MTDRPRRPIALFVALTTLMFSSSGSWGSTDHDLARKCDQAAAAAAHATGVPVDVLLAISRVETGRSVDGMLAPWPWAVNQAGNGSYFDTADQAMTHVADAIAMGQTNIDIGCFQINLRWHGQAFASLGDMFEPMENARYAATFLQDLYAEHGTWEGAIGAYHSRNPEAAVGYLAKVSAMMTGQMPDADQIDLPVRSQSDNRYPLLRPGTTSAFGSLVETSDDLPPVPLLR